MAEQKKMVEAITSMEEDFAKWYTDIVKKAELMDYSSVRGCMIIEPYGWAIWENIRDILDHEFKELGHETPASAGPPISGRGRSPGTTPRAACSHGMCSGIRSHRIPIQTPMRTRTRSRSPSSNSSTPSPCSSMCRPPQIPRIPKTIPGWQTRSGAGLQG